MTRQYNYYVDVCGRDRTLKFGSDIYTGFFIKSVKVDKVQALKIAKILYPDLKQIKILSLDNRYENPQ